METALIILSLAIVIAAVIAVIRRKGISPKASSEPTSAQEPAAYLALEPPPMVPDAIFIGSLDRPLAKILHVTGSTTPSKALTIPDSLKQAILPMVQRAPELFRVGQEIANKTFKLVFSPEVTQALNDGTLNLLKDGAGELLPVVQKDGRFFENGRVILQGGVKMANLAMMGWQIASVVTAQQYLSAIDAKLETIENALQDVLFILKEEKLAHVRAYIQLLRQYHSALVRGTLHPNEKDAIIQKLEDLEHECMAIGDLGKQMSKQKMEEMLSCERGAWFNRSGSAKQVESLIKDNEKALELMVLANSCRILACQVKASLPGDRHLAQERAAHAYAEVKLAETQLRVSRDQFLKGIGGLKKRDHVVALKGYFDKDHFQGLQEKYGAVETKAEEACKMLEGQAASTNAVALQLNQMTKQGIALTFELDSADGINFLAVEPDTDSHPSRHS
jgi:hypothetical protein